MTDLNTTHRERYSLGGYYSDWHWRCGYDKGTPDIWCEKCGHPTCGAKAEWVPTFISESAEITPDMVKRSMAAMDAADPDLGMDMVVTQTSGCGVADAYKAHAERVKQ